MRTTISLDSRFHGNLSGVWSAGRGFSSLQHALAKALEAFSFLLVFGRRPCPLPVG
jgi:hypothetical protein